MFTLYNSYIQNYETKCFCCLREQSQNYCWNSVFGGGHEEKVGSDRNLTHPSEFAIPNM